MAGVIKAGAPLPSQSGGPATAYPLDDIGQTYVARVRGEASVVANKLLADAKEEAAKIKGQAADEGRKAALAAVEQTLRTKLDGQLKTAAAALDQVVKQVQQARDAYLRAWEDQALSLALAIAERVIRREVAARPEITLTLMREALELTRGQERITVRLSPQDHAALGPKAADLLRTLAPLPGAALIADPAITPGGCRVDTEFGAVDLTIEAQLKRLAEELQ